jgi:type I restriction enzyme S subunit
MDTKNNILDNESTQLPAGWMVKKLGDVVDCFDKLRSPLSSIQRAKIHGIYPYYGAQGIIDYIDDYIFDGQYILIAEDGENLRSRKQPIANIAKGRFWLNNHAHVLRNNKDSNFGFIYYYLNFVNLSAFVTGAVQPKLNQENLFKIPILCPPIEEQKEIATILSSLDDKIELNHQINKKLEETAQAIFKEWFIDFNFPDENGNPYRDSGGAMVDSELGLIPASWSVKNLDEIAEFTNGLAMQKFRPCEHEKSLPVLKIKELRQDSTDINSDRCTVNIPDNVKVFDGDVVFSWSGSLMVDLWTGGCAGLNQHLFKVTSDKYSKAFYYLWTKYHLAEFIAIAQDKATTMGHIQRKHLSDAKVFCPDIKIMQKFNDMVNLMIEQIITNRVEAVKLANSRDILLPKLMSGEIRL